MKKYPSMKSIKQNVLICKKCNLCNDRKNAVPGKGNQNADIVFIGEAPGKNEDLLGEPFVGIAGKKLAEALKNSGLVGMRYILQILSNADRQKIGRPMIQKE